MLRDIKVAHGMTRWRVLLKGSLLVVGLVVLASVSACTGRGLGLSPGTSPTPITTSSATATAAAAAAQRILAQAKSVKLVDATFTIALTRIDHKAGLTETGSGTGTLTTQPMRFAYTFHYLDGSLAVEEVLDTETQSDYQHFTAPPVMASDKWDKIHSRIGLVHVEDTLVYYQQLTNATLVGSTTVDGVRVWHLHGMFPEPVLQVPVQADVYLRQDTSLPVKVETRDSYLTIVDTTYTFTAVNTGLSIPLPPPDQIKGG